MLSKLDDPYLDLLKKCIMRSTFPDNYRPYRHEYSNPSVRSEGRVRPAEALTMIGLKRLDNLHTCIEAVNPDQTPGDLIETGAWRGGACIFMRASLNDYGHQLRKIWLADSFEGLARPDEGDDLFYALFARSSEGQFCPVRLTG